MTKGQKPFNVQQAHVSSAHDRSRKTLLLSQYRHIRNKTKKDERIKRKQLHEQTGTDALKPLQIEDKREYDETYLHQLEEEDINEDKIDEFATYYDEQTTPKIVISTCRRPKKVSYLLATL